MLPSTRRISPYTFIYSCLISLIVPISSKGILFCFSICSRGPYFDFFNPSFVISPTSILIKGAFILSATHGGNVEVSLPISSTGKPKISLGSTFTAERTDKEGCAPCSCKQIACSQAELPKPTTNTFLFANGFPFLYSEL